MYVCGNLRWSISSNSSNLDFKRQIVRTLQNWRYVQTDSNKKVSIEFRHNNHFGQFEQYFNMNDAILILLIYVKLSKNKNFLYSSPNYPNLWDVTYINRSILLTLRIHNQCSFFWIRPVRTIRSVHIKSWNLLSNSLSFILKLLIYCCANFFANINMQNV
jgi:hypothetical protein